MNAVIALCHFCEVHGPVVVMCTQGYSEQYQQSCDSLQVRSESNTEKLKTYIHPNKLVHMREVALQEGSTNAPRHLQCAACTSISRDDLPYISNDHNTQTTYMSNQSPEDSTLFTLLRHACIRSLTCEITPGEDGAIYFGEDSNGHVLSYRFKLQNAMARGLRSTYSIVIISKDKLALLNLWPFLVPNLKSIVTRLQEAAQLVFSEEQTVDNVRSMRLGNSDLHPAANYRSRTGDLEPRSLISLTHQDKIFYKIHAWFTWLLRIGGSVFTEYSPSNNESGDEITIPARDVTVDQDSERAVYNLTQLYTLLGKAQFCTLAFHTVIGNQIIVRSSTASLAISLTEALSMLLPRGCVNREYSDSVYLPLFQYNIIALDVNVPLSQEVTSIDADPCVVILIEVKPHIDDTNDVELTADNVIIRMDSSQPPIVYSDYNLAMDVSPPKIVVQFLNFLDNALKLNAAIVAVNIIIIRNEWLNKAHLYYVFKRKQTNCRLSDNECNLRLQSFLKAIGLAKASDHSVLRFWVRGLSDESKKIIRSSVNKPDLKVSPEISLS